MKRASRFMPKYELQESGAPFLLWSFLAVVALFLIWLVWEFPYVLGLIPIIVIWERIETKRQKKKFDALAEERHELSICDFARSFDCKEIDTWVIRAVYEQIQEYIPYKQSPMPIKAGDELSEFLEIDDEDLNLDIVEEIAQRTGRSLENMETNPYYGKVITVQNLVEFINAQPLAKNT